MTHNTSPSSVSGVELDWDTKQLYLLFVKHYAPELLDQDDSQFENETEEQRKQRVEGYVQKTNVLLEKMDLLMSAWKKKLKTAKKDLLHNLESGINDVEQLPDFS